MTTVATPLTLATLPALGAELDGGTFVGLTTKPDGTHHAVVLLPEKAESITWKKAIAWAEKQGGELPSRPVAALLFANVKAQLTPAWHWTSESYDASYAWDCDFNYGGQRNGHKGYEGGAVAVRLIHLTA
jgi:hypothetical protein